MNKLFCAALAATCVLAMPAQATTLTINPITAAWGNVVGAGATLSTTGNGTASAGIRWGNPATAAGQSGYQFTAAAVPLNTNVVVNGVGSLFTLGGFTHINQPIFAPSITGAQLTISYGVAVGATNLGSYNAVFDFTHEETPNGDSPCLFGGANGQGVNINGCADRVTISLNSGASQFFNLDGVNYSLDISGFLAGGSPATEFLTIEQRENFALLRGRISAESVIGTGGVPEPQSWAMMLLGFGAVGIAARRRNITVAA